MSSLGNRQAKLKNKLQSILSFNENIEVPQVNTEVMTPILFILDLLSIITPNIDNIINKLFDDNFKSINNYVKTTLYENLILNIEESNIENLSFFIKISDIDNLELLNKDYNDLVYNKFYSNDLFNKGLRDIIKNNSEINLLNKGIIISRNNNELNIRFSTPLSYKDFLYNLIFDENFIILNKEIILSEITKFNFNYTLEENSFESNLDYLKIKELINNIELEKENIFDLQKYNKLDEEASSISKGTFLKKLGTFDVEKKVNNISFFKLFNSNDYINSYLDIDTNSDLIKDLNNIQNIVIQNTTLINEPLNILFKYNILKNFINTVTLRSILDPKVKLLFIMNKYIRTGNSEVNNNVIEFYQTYETLISKIINNLNKNFICFLFKILKKEILRILRNILTSIIKEKLITYKNIYLSLLLPRRDSNNNFQI
jgi:hypothetical protein